MTLVRVLSLSLMPSLFTSPAVAQEPVALSLAWPDEATWRVVDQWELHTSSGASEASRSGVVRGTWTVLAGEVSPTGARTHTLAAVEPLPVRATPRDDAAAKAVTAAIAEPWRVLVPPAPEAPAVASLEAPVDPVEEAPAVADGAVVSEEGSVTDEAVVTEAGAVSDEPVVPPDTTVGPALPPQVAAVVAPPTAPDRVALVHAGLPARLARLLAALNGASGSPDAPLAVTGLAGTGDEAVAVALGALTSCPDTGPGTPCVEVVVTRTSGGAAAVGEVPAGARREVERWLLEPTTLVPHAGHYEVEVAWTTQDGTAQRATATRALALSPAAPPVLQ